MKTSYFTFGQIHVHSYNGRTFDKNTVIKITEENPRKKMIELFGIKWGFEYDEIPNIGLYPNGVFNINENQYEKL